MPWENDLLDVGGVRAFFRTVRRALFAPGEGGERTPLDGPVATPYVFSVVVFAIVMGTLLLLRLLLLYLIGAPGAVLMATCVGALGGWVFWTVGLAVVSGALAVAARIVGLRDITFRAAWRLVCYASGGLVAFGIPMIGLFTIIFPLIFVYHGLRRGDPARGARSVLSVGLVAGMWVGIVLALASAVTPPRPDQAAPFDQGLPAGVVR